MSNYSGSYNEAIEVVRAINERNRIIHEQAAEIKRLVMRLDECLGTPCEQVRLINKVERLRKALESIAANTCCDSCQEAALVARAALAGKERKGQQQKSSKVGDPYDECAACGSFRYTHDTKDYAPWCKEFKEQTW